MHGKMWLIVDLFHQIAGQRYSSRVGHAGAEQEGKGFCIKRFRILDALREILNVVAGVFRHVAPPGLTLRDHSVLGKGPHPAFGHLLPSPGQARGREKAVEPQR